MSQPSYKKVVQIKSTGAATYGTVPANSASLALTSDLLDDTDFTTTGFRSRVLGIRDWNVTMTVLWDSGSTVINEIRSAWLGGTKLDMKYLPSSGAGWKGAGYVETMSLSGDIGGLETMDVTLQPDSALSTATSTS